MRVDGLADVHRMGTCHPTAQNLAVAVGFGLLIVNIGEMLQEASSSYFDECMRELLSEA